MAKCWTCGATVSGWQYTCSACQGLKELKDLHKKVESYQGDISQRLDYMAEAQQEGFESLMSTLSSGLSEIASAIEWGFGELSWQLQQQTDVLRSIDHTLKTPSETKANEWRLHAEELRHRGVLEESEEFFLKALNEYRLDYRIYVGLAETYLEMNKFDKAKVFLEKSLPHAPKKEIDYKSYSYRLIGHIYACEENYNQAVSILRTSIELSPTYEDGHYDYAQYSAQMRSKEICLFSLQKAILAKSIYWYLAQKERNFDPLRSEVEQLLSGIRMEASRRAENTISKAETMLKELDKTTSKSQEKVEEAISKAKQALIISRDKAELQSSTTYENIKSKYNTPQKLDMDI
jgi:tetratricopeptide (TPR) repeat protein